MDSFFRAIALVMGSALAVGALQPGIPPLAAGAAFALAVGAALVSIP